MSQYTSRIYIEVRDKKDWKKLKDIEMAQYWLVESFFEDCEDKYFYIDGDWSLEEGPMFDLVFEISSRIPDCIIFADTNNINVDPYNFIVYYLGDRVKTKEMEGDMQWETVLTDPVEWFHQHKIRLGKLQKAYLKEFNFE